MKCPLCKAPLYKPAHVTPVGVAFRCSGEHGMCGLRFDSMKRVDAIRLGVLPQYEAHPGPYIKGSDRA